MTESYKSTIDKDGGDENKMSTQTAIVSDTAEGDCDE